MKHEKLYLASQSPIRNQLLKEAEVPFTIIGQNADEAACDWSQPIEDLVLGIAHSKLNHAEVPIGREGDVCYVLTADTLVQGAAGRIYGKPINQNDAIKILRDLRSGVRVVTGFCCVKKKWSGGKWITKNLIKKAVGSTVIVDIPDIWIPVYLKKHPYALQTAGVLFVEGFGAQFITLVNGSYTTILGLPIYEVRQALEKLGFFDGFFSLSGE